MAAGFSWPNRCAGAVSLTFDDAARTQLDNAIPVLDRAGVRGTFYVSVHRETWSAGRAQWRAAAQRGHEIANHSLNHPCGRNFDWITPETALENYTLEKMEAELREASRLIREAIPEQRDFSFAYPCGQKYVGEGKARQSYVPVVARQFLAARGIGEVANDPLRCDLHDVWSWMVQGIGAAQMIAMVEEAVARGKWAVFCFHGIGGEHFAVATEELEGLVRHLATHRERIWTDTFYNVAAHITSHR